ncbi:MFS transporter [Rhodoplanes elegans]|uniref:MFS transporter n=1 Tax=Rhodoplanes elegans TaxID=29408 RepID=A0A327KMV7_9BRAD|nr:MFS transporter [Rhodoplanes elegans]MBK5958470.1 MFS transporter [Rhodoplanes elegans]RAI39681.1 MFS transporter [Rhodoplanes elegans]
MNFLPRSNFGADQEPEWRVYNKIALRLLPFLLVLYVISFLDRVNVGFAKLQMAADIGLSDAAFGFGAGVFFLGYCVCEIPSNLALQRFGAKIWIARIMVVWGLISAGLMFVTTETQFYVMRFLLGIAEAGFYPGIILYLTYWFPARLRSQICAIFFLGIAFSGVIGGPLSGWIMHALGGSLGLAGWQWLFLVEGLPAVFGGIAAFIYLDDGPAKAKWLSEPERRLVVDALTAEDLQKKAEGAGHRFGDAIRDVNVWLLAITNFALLGGTYGLSFWMPQIVKDLGVNNLLINGLLTAIPFTAASIAMIVVGKHSDRRNERKWHTAICAFVGAGGLVLSGMFGFNPYISLFGLSVAVAAALAGLAVMWALPATIQTGAAAAAGIALMATIGNLGGYTMPFILGWVKQLTQRVEFGLYAMAVMMVIGGLVMLVIPKLRRSATAPVRRDEVMSAT